MWSLALGDLQGGGPGGQGSSVTTGVGYLVTGCSVCLTDCAGCSQVHYSTLSLVMHSPLVPFPDSQWNMQTLGKRPLPSDQTSGRQAQSMCCKLVYSWDSEFDGTVVLKL